MTSLLVGVGIVVVVTILYFLITKDFDFIYRNKDETDKR